jgi:NADH-quinone oxidoreductase subunit C
MHSELSQLINSNVSGANAEHVPVEVGDQTIFISGNHILAICEFLKTAEDYEFNVLQVITGCDYEDRIEVSYILASFINNLEVILKVKLTKENKEHNPEIDSVCTVWSSANFQERECFDMLGVCFINHPDPRRILCPDDWEGYPLRKDYVPALKYNGMVINPEHKINREDIFFGEKLKRESTDPKKISYSWKKPEYYPVGATTSTESKPE